MNILFSIAKKDLQIYSRFFMGRPSCIRWVESHVITRIIIAKRQRKCDENQRSEWCYCSKGSTSQGMWITSRKIKKRHHHQQYYHHQREIKRKKIEKAWTYMKSRSLQKECNQSCWHLDFSHFELLSSRKVNSNCALFSFTKFIIVPAAIENS